MHLGVGMRQDVLSSLRVILDREQRLPSYGYDGIRPRRAVVEGSPLGTVGVGVTTTSVRSDKGNERGLFR